MGTRKTAAETERDSTGNNILVPCKTVQYVLGKQVVHLLKECTAKLLSLESFRQAPL